LFAYGINRSIGHSSTCSAGHGRVRLAFADADWVDKTTHLR